MGERFRLLVEFYAQIRSDNPICRRDTLALQTQLEIVFSSVPARILPGQQDPMSIFSPRRRPHQALLGV